MSSTTAVRFTGTLTRITPGGSGQDALDKLNAPLGEIEDALNKLSSSIYAIGTKGAIVRKYVPLSSDADVGSLVYFNYETSRFEPALAALLASNGKQGESIEAQSARVEGMVIQLDDESDITGTVTGTLLCSGFWDSAALVTACLGANAQAGMYFLSPTVAGTATRDPGVGLRQPVLSYYGDGQFCLGTHYLAHDSHFHSSAVLSHTWQSASTVETLYSVTAPSGAAWGYAVDDDSDCADLGEIDANVTAVFYDGALQPPSSSFIISDGILWSTGIGANLEMPTTGKTVLFNHYPFAYGSPVVRTIDSDNDFIQIVGNRHTGSVRLRAADFELGDSARSNAAVSWIKGKKLSMTPVVTAVEQGPGTSVLKQPDGSVVISLSDKVGSAVDAYSINHNGTHPASDGTFLYTLFPSGRSASLVMSMPVTGSSSTTELKAFVWGALTGTGASFTVKLFWSPLPESNDVLTDMPSYSSPGLTTTMSFAGTESGKLAYSETPSYLSIAGNGMLYAEVSILSVPTEDIKLTRLGFRMELANGGSAQGSSSNANAVGTAVTGTMSAGESVAKFRAVKIYNNSLVTCKSSETNDCDTCIGVSISSGSGGENINYVLSGIVMNIDNANFNPGGAVFVGVNGELTQTDPSTVASAMFIQKIGIALSSTSLQVGVRPGILKES